MNADDLFTRLAEQATPGLREAVFGSSTLIAKLQEFRQAVSEGAGRITLRGHRASILETARPLLEPSDQEAFSKLLDTAIDAIAP